MNESASEVASSLLVASAEAGYHDPRRVHELDCVWQMVACGRAGTEEEDEGAAVEIQPWVCDVF